jgi:hypothetical protein
MWESWPSPIRLATPRPQVYWTSGPVTPSTGRRSGVRRGRRRCSCMADRAAASHRVPAATSNPTPSMPWCSIKGAAAAVCGRATPTPTCRPTRRGTWWRTSSVSRLPNVEAISQRRTPDCSPATTPGDGGHGQAGVHPRRAGPRPPRHLEPGGYCMAPSSRLASQSPGPARRRRPRRRQFRHRAGRRPPLRTPAELTPRCRYQGLLCVMRFGL